MDGWQLPWWKPHIGRNRAKKPYEHIFLLLLINTSCNIRPDILKRYSKDSDYLWLKTYKYSSGRLGWKNLKSFAIILQNRCWLLCQAVRLKAGNNDRQQSRCSINCITIKTSITKLIDETKWSDSFSPPSVKTGSSNMGKICWLMVWMCRKPITVIICAI